jgi:DNA-binding NarL/FixJ family response regulator
MAAIGNVERRPAPAPLAVLLTSRPPVRVQLACEHQLVRQGLETMLASVGFVQLVPASTRALSPDVDVAIVAGERLPPVAPVAVPGAVGRDGVGPRPRTLMLIRDTAPAALAAAVKLSADGYVFEADLSGETLAAAIVEVVEVGTLVPALLQRYLLGQARNGAERVPAPHLTSREMEVLRLLTEGMTNRQVARQLRISENGAKRHVSNILNKLNCPNRALAVARALREGMLDAPPVG